MTFPATSVTNGVRSVTRPGRIRDIAWNLGLWRGEHGYDANVALAPELHGTAEVTAFREGHAYGRALRDARYAAEAAHLRATAARGRVVKPTGPVVQV